VDEEAARPPVPLADLATAAGLDPTDLPDVLISDVTHDHRQVRPGSLFCCVVGAHRDGHDLAGDAVAAGAAALLVQRPTGAGVPELVVPDTRIAMGPVAAARWGHPSRRLAVVGVTGTNGKTTVVTLIGSVLATLGTRVEVIGTLTGARTTPESTDLQRSLAAMVDRGVAVVAMEVSSHALVLGRVEGTHFEVGAFTNLGVDHLDFHRTPERYFAAKAQLFEPGRCDLAVVNIDDVHGRLLRDSIVPAGAPSIVTVTTEGASIELGPASSTFTWRDLPVRLRLAGRFNVTNALIAAECVVALGHDPAAVADALSAASAPPGRFELVSGPQPFTVVVDYAHTPDALGNVLATARELVAEGGRLLIVFGAGGDRDASKRPQMGAVASDAADAVYLTSDNPRSESPSAIMAAVAAGCHGDEPNMIEDRRAAISAALTAAGPGDVVVIAGKGHETTQVTGDEVVPFDDRVVASEVLAGLGHAGGGT